MGLLTTEIAGRDEAEAIAEDDMLFCHELTSLDELRALSDPLRVSLYRLLREDEHTVKELCDLLGESSTRLYYHVGVLERVGLVRLVRTEARSGIVQKYYRAVARFVSLPAWLLHEEMDSPQSRAAADWYGALIEHAAADVRALFGQQLARVDRDTIFFTRNFVRLSPERAREFRQRLEDLQAELVAADDEQAETRFAFTTAFVPVQWQGADAGRRTGRGHDRNHKPNVDEDDPRRSSPRDDTSGAAGKE